MLGENLASWRSGSEIGVAWAGRAGPMAGSAVFRRSGRGRAGESEWASQNGRGKALVLLAFRSARISLTGCTARPGRRSSAGRRGATPFAARALPVSLSLTAGARLVKSSGPEPSPDQSVLVQRGVAARFRAKFPRPHWGRGCGRRKAQGSATGLSAARNFQKLWVWVGDWSGPARKSSAKRGS